MTKAWKTLFLKVIKVAAKVIATQPWTWIGADETLLFEVPGESHPLAVTVMGHNGEEFGLFFLRGSHALPALREVHLGHGDTESLSILSVSLSKLRDIPRELRSLYKRPLGKQDPRRQVPHVFVQHPHRLAGNPSLSELKICLFALKGFLQAEAQDLLEPRSLLEEDEVQILILGGTTAAPTLHTEMRDTCDLPEPTSPPPPAGPRNPIIPLDLARLPRLDESWVLGLIQSPIVIDDDPRSVSMFVAAEPVEGLVVAASPIIGGELDDVFDLLGEAFRGGGPAPKRGLPKHATVAGDRQLYEHVRGFLAPLGIGCAFVDHDPVIDTLLNRISAYVTGGVPPAPSAPSGAWHEAPFEGNAWQYPEVVPDPDDLAAWKAADDVLIGRFAARIQASDLLGKPRPYQRYFGDHALGVEFLVAEGERGEATCLAAFTEWLAVFYRATRRSKTIAEKLLHTDLPAAQRILLENRVAAPPSLYRVTKVCPGKTFDVTEHATGRKIRIHGSTARQGVRKGNVFPGSVHAAGDFHYFHVYGSGWPAHETPRVVRYLESNGLTFTPESRAEKAHLFGRIDHEVDLGLG